MKPNEISFDESSCPTLTCDFAWSDLDHDALAHEQSFGFDPISAACECQSRVWAWVYQAPCPNPEGFLCRAVVASWIFTPELRDYSMTRIAEKFGKKKQSLGRWVADFKKEFPQVTAHLSHIRNHESHTPNRRSGSQSHRRNNARSGIRNSSAPQKRSAQHRAAH